MKKIISLVIVAVMFALTLCACGDDGKVDEAALVPVTAGVSSADTLHTEVLYGLELHFPEHSHKLVYKQFESSQSAIDALVKGEVDFTMISNKTELEESGAQGITNLGPVYFYPYSIYLMKFETKADVTDCATIAVPDDAQGIARALMLLDANGFITLKEDAGLDATLDDIEQNKKEFEIKPMPHDSIASSDADILVMGSQQATAAGFERRFDAITSEKSDSAAAIAYAVVCLVRTEDLRTEKIGLVDKFFFTRRMFNAIDGSTNKMIEPMFEIKTK